MEHESSPQMEELASQTKAMQQHFEDEWSRLIPVLGGGESLKQLQSCTVLIIGMKGLGIEIAKNLVLMGVNGLSIFDEEPVHISDLSAQFFLSEQDVGHPRANACVSRLRELNERVKLQVLHSLDHETLITHQVVVSTNNRSLRKLLTLSDFCHANSIRFIAADVWGLFTYVFIDLGHGWHVSDANGEPPKTGYVESITQDEQGLVTLWDEKLHDLEDGDIVGFSGVEGMTQLNEQQFEIRVVSPYQFSIGDTRGFGTCTKGGTFHQIKQPLILNYKSLRDMMEEKPQVFSTNSTAITSDWSKAMTIDQYHLTAQALLEFYQCSNRLPAPYSQKDVEEVLSLAKRLNSSRSKENQLDEVDEQLIAKIASVSSGDISPMDAFVGGIVAQEVIKASTAKFTPIYQWFFFDALECLPDQAPTPQDLKLEGTRYDGQIAIFGNKFQEKLANSTLFLVGAGAIGCEMLKNWAMMGAATAKGRVHVTDIDTIEISNLNRQFLFRYSDISKSKSQVAASAVQRMNAELNIKHWNVKAHPETENIFDEKFWRSLDGVVTALDNVQARRYVDSKCVFYSKSMLDSGTQGTKGNTQVIVPHMTESYSASGDPPESVTPVCLLHQFPNSIEHCLQWAREVHFEGLFARQPDIVNNWLENENYINTLDPMIRATSLEALQECLCPKLVELAQCFLWARQLYEKIFVHNVQQLLFTYPPNHVDENGTPFWSGGKLLPTVIKFDSENKLHMSFVTSAAYMRAYSLGILSDEFKTSSLEENQSHAKKELQRFTPTQWNPEAEMTMDKVGIKSHQILASLPPRQSLSRWRMRPIQFEKDDDRNFHVDFIWSAANIRAISYGIKPIERLEAKIIAGKIIPAIVTTTALVTGLVCLELYKVLQNKGYGSMRNTFVNLANCIFQSAEPVAPVQLPFQGQLLTEWDFIDVKRGDLTLAAFFHYMKVRHNVKVDGIMYSGKAIYMDFMPPQKIAARLKKKLSELVAEVSGMPLASSQSVFCLSISGTDADGNSLSHIPSVRVWYKTKPKKRKSADAIKATLEEKRPELEQQQEEEITTAAANE